MSGTKTTPETSSAARELAKQIVMSDFSLTNMQISHLTELLEKFAASIKNEIKYDR